MQVHLGHQVWPYLACQASLINHHNQRHIHSTLYSQKKSKVALPDAELETGAEPIQTCLNRTSHQERSHLLPTVISRSFAVGALSDRSSLASRPAEHHRPRLHRPGLRSCS